MPALSSIKTPIKGLVLADSGLGKTGMLWSLAVAGFKLRLFDADSNSGVLASALRAHPEALARVEVNYFSDFLKTNAEGFPTGTPKAWKKFLDALDYWPDATIKDDKGKVLSSEGVGDWGPDTVVVIDTLTSLGKAALHKAQSLEVKMGKLPEIQHYHTAGVQIEGLLAKLRSDEVRCHVLVLTHINYVKSDIGAMFGLPKAIGEKLSENVPIYFNTMVALKRTGKKVSLSTRPTAMVQTKVEGFDKVKEEYTLIDDGIGKPGLAEFFKDCGHEGPL